MGGVYLACGSFEAQVLLHTCLYEEYIAFNCDGLFIWVLKLFLRHFHLCQIIFHNIFQTSHA